MNKNFFENGKDPILIADLPANPLDNDDLNHYVELGFNSFILTEDYNIPFTENGIITEKYKEAIKRVSDKGLDIYVRNMQNDADYFQNDDSEKERSNYGTPYKLPKRNITDELKQYKNIKGFYMADESYGQDLKDKPLFSSFDKLEKLVDWKNKYYPDLFWHMNHVGSPSYDHFYYYLGYTYEDFLQIYCDKIIAKLTSGGKSICLDYYPFSEPGEIEFEYFYNILTGARITKRYNFSHKDKATFGICIQCHQNLSPIGEGLKRDLSCKEEISLQINCAFALGANLLEYFCYHSLEDYNMFGMVRKSSSHTYDFVKAANKECLPMGKIVSSFEFMGAFINCGKTCENKKAFLKANHLFLDEAVYNKEILSLNSSYDLLIGAFYQDPYNEYMKGAKQSAYYLVNYTDPSLKHQNHVELKFNTNKALLCHQGNFKELELEDSVLSLDIVPGDAFFVIPLK